MARRSYPTSTFRIFLLVVLLAAAAFTATGMAQDATPAPDAAPAAPAAASDGETRSVPQRGLLQLIFSHPDAVFFTIAILSVIGLALIIQGFMKNRTSVFMPPQTVALIRDMISQRRFKELMEFTETDNTFISKALNPALKRAPSFAAMKEAMETAIGEQTAEQFRKIEYLNIIGNLGPLLGLLGTVLGMIYAFQAVAATGGQADVGALSDGISIALTHTFLGLFLAVPCLAAFGVLRTMVDRLTVRGSLVAEELLLMIKPADSKGVASPTVPGGRPAAAPIPATRRATAAQPQPQPGSAFPTIG